MSFDLGKNPIGRPPTAEEIQQMKDVLGVADSTHTHSMSSIVGLEDRLGTFVYSDPSEETEATATQITNIIRITQTQYNDISVPDANITYIIIPD